MQASKTLNVQEPVARATAWDALCALAVGGLLGSAVMLCSLWIKDALWCTALQSAGTALVLAIPVHFGSQTLSLNLWNETVCMETERGLSPAEYCALGAPARAAVDAVRADLANELGFPVESMVYAVR